MTEEWVKITFGVSKENRKLFYEFLKSKNQKPWEWFKQEMEKIKKIPKKPVIRNLEEEALSQNIVEAY